MDAEISSRLAKYLDVIESGVKSSADFIQEQAPLVVQEFLAWRFWSSVCTCVVMIAIIAMCVYFCRKIHKRMEPGDEPVFIIPVTIAAICAVSLYFNAGAAIKVKLAPRLVLIEEIRELQGK